MSLPDIIDLASAEAERAVTALGPGDDEAPVDEALDRLAGHGLTSREQEVARLLALRLSDKEIARRLSISPRTVSTHVTVILGKLGVHSRRDVPRFAAEPGPDGAGESAIPATNAKSLRNQRSRMPSRNQ